MYFTIEHLEICSQHYVKFGQQNNKSNSIIIPINHLKFEENSQ